MNPDALSRIFDDYAAYHRHPSNKICHYIGIPVIVFTIVGLLGRLELGSVAGVSVSAAVPVALFVLAYDARFSLRLTALFGAFVAASLLAAPRLPVTVLWAGFAAGWILQFVGHYVYERKSPAFFENLRQLLVGPLWILAELTEKRTSAG